jgi:hypothetical protein
MRLMSPEEFEAELSQRDCNKLGRTKLGYTVWETEDGNPFSVPPPEEAGPNGQLCYPDWMLDDLIKEVGLSFSKRPKH